MSLDVDLWRADSERRGNFREMVRRRNPSYFDEEIAGGEEDGQEGEDGEVEGECERGLAVVPAHTEHNLTDKQTSIQCPYVIPTFIYLRGPS